SLLAYVPMRLATLLDSEKMAKHIAKAFVPIHTMKPKDFLEMWKDFKGSGFRNIGDTVQMVDRHGAALTLPTNSLGKLVAGTVNAGLLPFNEAELFNRMFSYIHAWK